jgi:hypothetical protein
MTTNKPLDTSNNDEVEALVRKWFYLTGYNETVNAEVAKAVEAINTLLNEARIDELKRFTDFPYQAAVDENDYTGKEVVKDIERRLKTLQEGSSE